MSAVTSGVMLSRARAILERCDAALGADWPKKWGSPVDLLADNTDWSLLEIRVVLSLLRDTGGWG